MKKLIFIIIIASLAGCKSKPAGEYSRLGVFPQATYQKEFAPLQAKTGEIIIDSWRVQKTPTIEIERDINGFSQSSKKTIIIPVKINEQQLPVTIFAGKAVLSMSDTNWDFYVSERQSLIVHGRSTHYTKGGVAISKHGRPAHAFIVPVNYSVAQIIRTADPIIHTPADPIVVHMKYQGTAQTITYNGLVDGQIRFIYREFSGAMIRDAYTQEFAFDYTPGKEYSYKNARFIVHEATPTNISITQTAHF